MYIYFVKSEYVDEFCVQLTALIFRIAVSRSALTSAHTKMYQRTRHIAGSQTNAAARFLNPAAT
jgi:hypothetical protein